MPANLNTGTTCRSAMGASLILCVFVIMGALCAAPTSKPASKPEPKRIPEYEAMVKETIRKIDTSAIKKAVKELTTDDEAIRAAATKVLESRVGVRFRYGFREKHKDLAREVETKAWQRYADGLEKAIEEKLPKITEEPTWRNRSRRASAVRFLGRETPHRAFLPLLRTIVENEKEDRSARHLALTSITRIPHEGMIDYLIDQIGTDLSQRAWEQLDKLTRSRVKYDPDNLEGVKRKYQVWWKKNKSKYVYKRLRALMER